MPSRVSAALMAAAQFCLWPNLVGADYPGVAPGAENPPPKSVEAQGSRRTLVTWPGFQLLPAGGSRVFVQVTGQPDFETERKGDSFVIRVKNARIHLRNNQHPLDTRFFETPVLRVVAEPRGKDVAVVLTLREDRSPEVRFEAGAKGYSYILATF